MATEPGKCPRCGDAVAEGARFCPNCGTQLAAAGDTRPFPLPPTESGRTPVNVVVTEPRFFGLTPPLFSFGLGCAGLALAIVFFVLGRWPIATIVLLLALVFFALFLGVARRRPTSPVTRAAAHLADGAAARAHFVGGSVGAWWRAGRGVARVRRELRGLRSERERVQSALGAAAYLEEETKIASLRARMREIDDQIETRDAAAREAVEQARKRVGRERLAMKPTERIVTEDAPQVADTEAGRQEGASREVPAKSEAKRAKPPKRKSS